MFWYSNLLTKEILSVDIILYSTLKAKYIINDTIASLGSLCEQCIYNVQL